MTHDTAPWRQPAADQSLPGITAVVATKDRPALLRRALRSILAQDYPGTLEIVVVFDQHEIDPLTDLVDPSAGRIPILRVRNSRTPGLAGGRNTGIRHSRTDLVAFCDDDDEWLPGKLSAQVDLWRAHPDASAISCAMRIVTRSGSHLRMPEAVVRHRDFLTSRVAEVHTSSLLVRRRDVDEPGGFVDETLPSSYGEDYDMLLKLSRDGDVRCVREPLLTVHWDRPSFFAEKWRNLAAGLTHLIATHPDLIDHPRNAARMHGQIAFAHAAAGDRTTARTWARRAMSTRRTEPRVWATFAVTSGVMSPEVMVRTMNSLGKGL